MDTLEAVAARARLTLASGENPYQQPAFVVADESDDPLALHRFHITNAETLCFTNAADIDAVLRTLCLAAEAFRACRGAVPFITVAAKHGNACGLGVDWSSPEASIRRALLGSPVAVWGGECITNAPIDSALARPLLEVDGRAWMLDVIAAPAFDAAALALLGQRKRRKLLANPALGTPHLPRSAVHARQVRGGWLLEPEADFVLTPEQFSGPVTDAHIIAWSVAFSSFHGGNEIALARDDSLVGVGGGPATVEAARVAVTRARDSGHDPQGSAFAADAFFPFTDGPEILWRAGCAAGLAPAGGMREAVVRSYFEDHGIDMLWLPSDIRGFCRH